MRSADRPRLVNRAHHDCPSRGIVRRNNSAPRSSIQCRLRFADLMSVRRQTVLWTACALLATCAARADDKPGPNTPRCLTAESNDCDAPTADVKRARGLYREGTKLA